IRKIVFNITSMKKIITLSLILFLGLPSIFSQGSNVKHERILMGNAKHILSGLDLSPDGQHIAISSVQSFPFYIYDLANREPLKEYNVGEWYAGSSVKYSPDGKYILIQQLYYTDFAPNKDREVTFQVIDATSGEIVKRFDDFHAVTFTPDSIYALSLTGTEVAFWNLVSGKKEKSFKVTMASNGVAISPDGKHIAVSHHLLEIDLAKHPRYKKDKKARKHVMKYKHQITVYNAETFDQEYTVDEFYDIVYRLEYSQDGKTLFCLQIPHMKAQASVSARQTYIATINGVTGEPSRRGFTSQAIYEPDFKLSRNGKLFGVVSKGSRFVELHIYDFETGKILERYEQSIRFFEKSDGEFIAADDRSSFVFLPDNKTVVMTMGNHLIFWELKLDK
ncbi:MAG: hypothetical protein K8S16_05490, partial [Bacteroidales bacterium]|nr:hypothetical protein [Bacteroidales bacterium]